MAIQFKGHEEGMTAHLRSFYDMIEYKRTTNKDYSVWQAAEDYVKNQVDMESGMEDYYNYEKEIARRNTRLLKAIKSIKGRGFYKRLLEEIDEADGIYGQAEIVKEPKGDYQKHTYGRLIRGIWVDQWQNGGHTGDNFAGHVYIQIKENKYFKFQYSC